MSNFKHRAQTALESLEVDGAEILIAVHETDDGYSAVLRTIHAGDIPDGLAGHGRTILAALTALTAEMRELS